MGVARLGVCPARGMHRSFLIHLQRRPARITHTHFLSDSEMRKRGGTRGTLLIEHLATVAAVVFAVGERERCATTETDVRIDPFGCSTGGKEGFGFGYGIGRREFES